MGREIKRVPLDFEWPLEKVWSGFRNPHYEGHCSTCTECAGSGFSAAANRLQELWYGRLPFHPGITGNEPFTENHKIVRALAEHNCKSNAEYYGSSEADVLREAVRLAEFFNASWSHHLDRQDISALLNGGRLMDFTHNPRTPKQVEIVRKKVAAGGNSWLPKSNRYVPTPREVNDWSLSGFGHDSINCYIVVKAKCKRLGVPHECALCKGTGNVWDSIENKRIAEEWKEIEPPTGDGWQVWETVSEGSPLTPVFPCAEDLVEHLALHGDSSDHAGWGYESAAAFVGVGWVPTGASKDGEFIECKDVALKMGLK